LPPLKERNRAVAMRPANVASVRQKFEVFSDEHCSCCRDALASAAHELKTPLAIMGGYLHLLLAQKLGPLNPRQMEVLTEMQANGARLSNFIQNLLTYATLKVDRFEMQYEAGDINGCVREIAEVGHSVSRTRPLHFTFCRVRSYLPSPSTTTKCSILFPTCWTMP